MRIRLFSTSAGNSIGYDRVEGVGCGRGQRSGKRALTWRIGVLVKKDRNEARDLTQCWLVITGKNGELNRSKTKVSPEKRREQPGGWWRIKTVSCSPMGESWATTDPLPLF